MGWLGAWVKLSRDDQCITLKGGSPQWVELQTLYLLTHLMWKKQCLEGKHTDSWVVSKGQTFWGSWGTAIRKRVR